MVVPGCLARRGCAVGWALTAHFGRYTSLVLRVFSHVHMGRAQLSGHILKSGACHCFLGC